jgi:hypothetical protein
LQLHPEVQDDAGTSQEKTVHRTVAPTSAVKISKRKLDARSEEAYAVMKQLSSNVKQQDEFDVYGEYVANTDRSTSLSAELCRWLSCGSSSWRICENKVFIKQLDRQTPSLNFLINTHKILLTVNFIHPGLESVIG